MSRREFSDDCPGCKPVLVDPKTKRVCPPDSAPMRVLMSVWNGLTREERRAFHAFTCLNDCSRENLEVMRRIVEQFQARAKQ